MNPISRTPGWAGLGYVKKMGCGVVWFVVLRLVALARPPRFKPHQVNSRLTLLFCAPES